MPAALLLCLPAFLAFIYNFFLSSLDFTPQLIAILSIALTIYSLKTKNLYLPLLVAIICLLVFTTSGLTSPFFILIDFLLFSTAFLYHPLQTFTLASLLVFLLANSIDGTLRSWVNLGGLLLIVPLAWLTAKFQQNYTNNLHELAQDQTDIGLWLHLEFKRRLLKNLEILESLLSKPDLSERTKKDLDTVLQHEKYFLHSSKKLSQELSQK